MTDNDRIELLKEAVESHGSQAKIGKMLGYSPATISQVLSEKYPGDLGTLLAKVEEIFGSTTVECPILGTILLGQCVDERNKPFSSANPTRVRLYVACRKCEMRG